MANGRRISTNFWKDNYIVDLDPTEKLLFIYLLTNPRTNLLGVYEINIREMAFDTGIDRDMILKILGRFENDQKVWFRDGWVVLVNFLKHQNLNASMRQNLTKVYLALPNMLKMLCELNEDQTALLFTGWGQGVSTMGALKENKIKENKIKVPKGTLRIKAPQVVDDSPYGQVSKLYYETIKSLELPVMNHNVLRRKISEMSKMQNLEMVLNYLEFMRDNFANTEWDFKPDVNSALDIFSKRVQIRNSLIRHQKTTNQTRGVKL